jgi:hypothetical protein
MKNTAPFMEKEPLFEKRGSYPEKGANFRKG